MHESPEELAEHLISLLQAKIGIEVHFDEPLLHKIHYSAHHREECDLSGKEISGKDLASFLASHHLAKDVEYFSVQIKGLIILGQLDLDSVNIKFPLVFKNCIFKDNKDDKGDIILRDARTRYLSFQGCQCEHINASRLVVDGQLWLNRGFSANKGIQLNNAKISGNIDLSGATINPIQEEIIYRGKSLVLDCATIGGSLWLWSKNQEKRFESCGEISLIGAVIGGNFICHKAKLKSDIQYLNDKHDKSLALIANSATVKGSIEFSKGFEAEGQMLLMNMEVHGDLKCKGGKFSHSSLPDGYQSADPHKHAISFDRSVINGSIFLSDGFEAIGQVRLIGTTIKNDLDCSGGSFSLSPHADCCFSIFVVRGCIQGDVSFCKTQLGRDGHRNFVTNGLIYLNSVKIGNNLDLTRGVEFNKNNLKENGLRAHSCRIRGKIRFNKITSNNETEIDLVGTSSVGLSHNWNAFLAKNSLNKLAIDRFVYDKYECYNDDNGSEDDSTEWLTLLNDPSLGCHQQLATVLTKNGRRPKAVEVLISMEEKRISQRGRFGRFISPILKHGIGFGHRPQNALLIAFVAIIFSGFIFKQSYDQKAFYPTSTEVSKEDYTKSRKLPLWYPNFNSFAFSVETFFPVLDLDFGVKKNWNINDKARLSIGSVKFSSESLMYYSWFHKFVGWIISTLIVGGFTAYFIRK